MQTDNRTMDTALLFAPAWTRRAVLSALAGTVAVYFGLPYIEMLSHPSKDMMKIRTIDSAAVSMPAPPKPKELLREKTKKAKPPEPKLKQNRRQMMPLQVSMNLGIALSDVGGDFAVDFNIKDGLLAEQIKDLVFEIGDVDEPPRPMVRLNPMYPPQARMRRIQGEVVTEFIVEADGTTSNITVTSSTPGDTFVNAAVKAVKAWRFSPGTKEGKPVATRVRQTITFNLE